MEKVTNVDSVTGWGQWGRFRDRAVLEMRTYLRWNSNINEDRWKDNERYRARGQF
jgi:hypothetical protein